MLGTGYFLKIAKLIPSKKNQSVLMAKISFRKTKKNCQSANISCHTIGDRQQFLIWKHETNRTCLFHSEKKRYTVNYWFYIGYPFDHMYFYCTYLTKTKILSMLGTGYFLKIAKLIPSKKNQSVLMAKISFRKTKKNCQSANISCHTIGDRQQFLIWKHETKWTLELWTSSLENHSRLRERGNELHSRPSRPISARDIARL